MGWPTLIAIYFTIWWIVLFAVLPWGARPPEEVEPGMASSAPARPMLVKKFIWTTVLTTIIVVGGRWLFTSGLIDWAELMRIE
ncbi:DUF1467 family protein [Indioceanicola profundi]|uniref:DUF1467 family protein n=1 Tax=Indioceanicola profundi TaxID=2220096 RepID=UPI000E6AB6D7|nr:DUF1467 family protein [Indioceanicola profundi]